MFLQFFLILLGFPLLELVVSILAAQVMGLWVVLWLLPSAACGAFLLWHERASVFGRMVAALRLGQDPFPALLMSGRRVLAALLLLLPGLLSDALALFVLLWPAAKARGRPRDVPGTIIEGSFQRED